MKEKNVFEQQKIPRKSYYLKALLRHGQDFCFLISNL